MRLTQAFLLVVLVLGLAVVVATLPAPAPAAHADDLKAGEVVTLKGELLDLACYLGSGKTGPSHRKCAAMCAKGGQPMGLLTVDGKVLVLVSSHESEKAYNQAKELCGATVELKGKLMEQKGVWGIEVHEVKEVKG